MPWTALRHGSAADWSSLSASDAASPGIVSLEIRAMNLPERSPAMKKENTFSNNALESTSVDFTNLACLKLCGNSKFMATTDRDLTAIGRTAKNFRKIQMSNAASFGPKGIGALVRSSRLSLEILELEHSFQTEPETSEQHNGNSNPRLSQSVAQCPLLPRLRLQSVHTCRDSFACDDIAYNGTVQIWLGPKCFQVPQPEEDTAILYSVLEQTRRLMDSRTPPNANSVEIDIIFCGFIFEPMHSLVHGDFETSSPVRQPWMVEKKKSHKELQSATYMRLFPFCITQDEFKDGLTKGYGGQGHLTRNFLAIASAGCGGRGTLLAACISITVQAEIEVAFSLMMAEDLELGRSASQRGSDWTSSIADSQLPFHCSMLFWLSPFVSRSFSFIHASSLHDRYQ